MPIPNQIQLALEESQLSTVEGETVIESGHKIVKKQWRDHRSGKIKKGFYKPVEEDKTYPRLLAKYEVACQVRAALANGFCIPRNYLVFNDRSEIVGMVSEEIENFRSLEDGLEITTELLIANNAAIIIEASILLECDDRHPQNFGYRERADGSYEFFIIDLDMALYSNTVHIKGGRDFKYDTFARTITPDFFELTRYDIDNSPHVQVDRVHWFTHSPKNLNVKKAYKPSTLMAFQALAGDPRYHLQAHERHAFALVTYDSQCLKARLFEVLGTIPLHYMSLPGAKYGLEANFPDLYHQQSDQQAFIDTMMKIFDAKHHHNYRVVVSYPGCSKNCQNVPKISFHQYLLQTPELLEKILVWAETQNHQMGEVSPQVYHNLESIQSNFHEMWRDSFILRIRSIIINFQHIQKQIDQEAVVMVEPLSDLASMEASVYMPKVTGKEQDEQTALLGILKHFIRELSQLFNAYFAVSGASPEVLLQANKACCVGVKSLLAREEKEIAKWSPTAHITCKSLKILIEHLDYSAYLARKKSIPHGLESVKPMRSPLFNPSEVGSVAQYLQLLFDWAANPQVLPVLVNSIEISIIKNTPSLSNFYKVRDERSEEISRYLKRATNQHEAHGDASLSIKGTEILAYILGNGKVDGYALNTLIMDELFKIVLQDSYRCLNIDVESFLDCYNDKTLDMRVYTAAAKSYIQRDKRYTHVLTEVTQNEFIRVLYRWVDAMAPESFRKQITDTLQAYNFSRSALVGYFFSSRSQDIQADIKDYKGSNSAILGMIFSKGGRNDATWKDVQSFNHRLYNSLLDKLFAEKKSNPLFNMRYQFPEELTREEAGTFLHLPQFQEQAIIRRELATKFTAEVAEVAEVAEDDGFVVVDKAANGFF